MLNIAYLPAVEESMYTDLKITNWSKTYDFSRFTDGKVCMRFIVEWENLYDVDCFLCTNHYDWQDKWIKKIYKLHLESRLVYHMTEPETVMVLHTKSGSNVILKYYHYILSWNLNLVNNKNIFFCLPMSYRFDKFTKIDPIPFHKKKLLVNISGNKGSDSSRELYSERRRVIDYCEKYFPDDFDLFGPGWEKEALGCYRGVCDDKYETYQKYKFALCLENECGKTYITEKILDCLVGGVVPVYYGAPNITEYISDTCFVPYEQFASIEDLLLFLSSMSFERYQEYILAAESWLNSEGVKKFGIESLANDIGHVAELCRKDEETTFHIKKKDLLIGRTRRYCKKCKHLMGAVLNKFRSHA